MIVIWQWRSQQTTNYCTLDSTLRMCCAALCHQTLCSCIQTLSFHETHYYIYAILDNCAMVVFSLVRKPLPSVYGYYAIAEGRVWSDSTGFRVPSLCDCATAVERGGWGLARETRLCCSTTGAGRETRNTPHRTCRKDCL